MLRSLATLVLLLGCAHGVARAETPRPALHWSRARGAEGCIAPRELALRVTQLTGPVLVEPTSAALSIEGHVSVGKSGAFFVRVTSTGRDGRQHGERTLEHAGANCRDLDDAIAFIIAVMIDPDLALEKLPPSLLELGAEGPPADQLLLEEMNAEPAQPTSPAPTPASHAVPPKVTPRVAAAPVSAPVLGWELGLGGYSSGRELPKAVLGASVQLALVFRRWLALEAQLRVGKMLRPHALDAVREMTAHHRATALLLCPRRRLLAKLYGEACLGPELYVARARGHGFMNDNRASLRGVAAQLGAGIAISLPRSVFIKLRGFVRLMPNTQRFVYWQGDGEQRQELRAFVIPRFASGASLSILYAF